MKKIAFLFILIDNPNFPILWDEYFKNNEDKHTIYIHTKYPEKHTWRPKNIIKDLKETAWGHIVEAEVSLFKEAYEDEDNFKFITISESCVPIKNFNVFYNNVTNDIKSWIKIMEIKKYDFNERIVSFIEKINDKNIIIPPIKTFIKHYARYCLNRYHINKILEADITKKMIFFYKMPIGDEFCLTILNIKDNEYKDFAVTFDDWDYVAKEIKIINNIIGEIYDINKLLKKNNGLEDNKEIKNFENNIEELKLIKNNIAKNPKMITILNIADLENIKNTDSYFYRKFSKQSNIGQYWNGIIDGIL
jgi:hypothetical protein